MSSGSKVHPGQTVHVSLRIDDLTPAGHVGNVSAVRLIDEARMILFGHSRTSRVGYHHGVLADLVGEVQYLVRKNTIEYASELWYSREPLTVTLWVTGIGRTTFSLASTVSVGEDEPPAILAESVIVLLDRDSGRPWQMTETVRAEISRYLGPPIELHRASPRNGTASSRATTTVTGE